MMTLFVLFVVRLRIQEFWLSLVITEIIVWVWIKEGRRLTIEIFRTIPVIILEIWFESIVRRTVLTLISHLQEVVNSFKSEASSSKNADQYNNHGSNENFPRELPEKLDDFRVFIMRLSMGTHKEFLVIESLKGRFKSLDALVSPFEKQDKRNTLENSQHNKHICV